MHSRPLLLTTLLFLSSACTMQRAALRPTLRPIVGESVAVTESLPTSGSSDSEEEDTETPLARRSPFLGDAPYGFSEDMLRDVLEGPVAFEPALRVGIVTVVETADPEPPLATERIPEALTAALGSSGRFSMALEVATDFAAEGGVKGLRELAARYRTPYLLLYRRHFVGDAYLNPLAWSFVTGVGALFMPGNTLEAAGILEASLFDARTGSILFTVNERVHGSSVENVWNEGRKLRWLQEKLLERGVSGLTRKVTQSLALLAVEPSPGENRTRAQARRTSGGLVRFSGEGQ